FSVVVGTTVLVFLPVLVVCPSGARGFAHDDPEERVVDQQRGTFLKPGPVRVGQAEQRSQTELEGPPDEHPVERAREPMPSEGGRGEGVDRARHGTVAPVHEFDGGHASMLGYRPQDGRYPLPEESLRRCAFDGSHPYFQLAHPGHRHGAHGPAYGPLAPWPAQYV